MFHCISAVRNTEAKFKVETFQEFITEKMALYHSEFIHWFLSHNKFYPEIKKKYEPYYWIFITPILGRIIKSESFYRSCLESLIIHAKHFDNTPGIEIDFFFLPLIFLACTHKIHRLKKKIYKQLHCITLKQSYLFIEEQGMLKSV